MEKKFKEQEKGKSKKEGDFTEHKPERGVNRGITSADIVQCSKCGKKYFRGDAHQC